MTTPTDLFLMTKRLAAAICVVAMIAACSGDTVGPSFDGRTQAAEAALRALGGQEFELIRFTTAEGEYATAHYGPRFTSWVHVVPFTAEIIWRRPARIDTM